MAWDKSGTEREVASLKKRYPSKGITGNIPDDMRASMAEEERQKLLQRNEKESRYAKGGVTRADGCAKRGRTRGRMV